MRKIISSLLIFTLLIEPLSFGLGADTLSPWTGMAEPEFKRSVWLKELEETRLVRENTELDRKKLEYFGKGILFNGHGKILASEQLRSDPKRLMKELAYEEIRMALSYLAGTRSGIYTLVRDETLKKREIISAYYRFIPEARKYRSKKDIFFIRMMAEAISLVSLTGDGKGYILDAELSPEEKCFVEAVSPVITFYRDTFFTDLLFSGNAREILVRSLLTTRGEEVQFDIPVTAKNGRHDEYLELLRNEVTKEYDYFKTFFDASKDLMPHIIVYELIRLFVEQGSLGDHDFSIYAYKLSLIIKKRPDLIMPNMVNVFCDMLESVNKAKALAAMGLIGDIAAVKPELIGDNVVSRVLDKLYDVEMIGKDKTRVQNTIAKIAGAKPARAREFMDILASTMTLSGGELKYEQDDMEVYTVIYGADPGQVDDGIFKNLFRALMMKMDSRANVHAIVRLYAEKPEYRDKIIEKIFSTLHSEHYRSMENYGRILALIAKRYPERREEVIRRLSAALDVKGDRNLPDDPNIWVSGSVYHVLEGSFDINFDIIDRKFFNKILKLLLITGQSRVSDLGFREICQAYIVEKPGDLKKSDLLDMIEGMKKGEAFKKQDIARVFSVAAEKRGDLLDRDMINEVRKLLDDDMPREDVVVDSSSHTKGAACLAYIGAYRSRPELFTPDLKDLVERAIGMERYGLAGDVSLLLAEFVKGADKAYGERIIGKMFEHLEGHASTNDIIDALTVIITNDRSYITPALVEKILPYLKVTFNQIAESTRGFLITVAALDPYGEGKKVLSDLVDRLRKGVNPVEEHDILDVAEGVALKTPATKSEEIYDLLKSLGGGFGVSDEDMIYGFGFLFGLAEKRDIMALDTVFEMASKSVDSDAIGELFRLAFAYLRKGEFDSFLGFLSEREGGLADSSDTAATNSIEAVVTEARNGLVNINPAVREQMDRRLTGGWNGVQAFVEEAVAHPVLGEMLLDKIIVSLRFLRQGVGDDVGFGTWADVEDRLPRIRNAVVNLLPVRDISFLTKRQLMKVMPLGDEDFLNTMREQARQMVIARSGSDRRDGLIGNLRNDIHNRPSPLQLETMKVLMDWLRAECSDPALESRLSRMGYPVDDSDRITDPERRERVLAACEPLLISLEEVYGEGNENKLDEMFTEWSRSLENMAEEKEFIQGAIRDSRAGGKPSIEVLDRLSTARLKLKQIIINSPGQSALPGMKLLNALEVLFFRLYTGMDKNYDDIHGDMDILRILSNNVIANGYDPGALEYMMKELAAMSASGKGTDLGKLYSIIKRMERYINLKAMHGVRRYQELAEHTAVGINVSEDDKIWVENFSSNIFRSDNIYLFALALKDIKRKVMEKGNISMWQVVVPGKMRGKFKMIKDPAELAMCGKGDIIVADNIPADSPPLKDVGGIIVFSEDSLLSHPAIRARQYGVPFAVCPDERVMDEIIEEYQGKNIEADIAGNKLVVVPEGDESGGAETKIQWKDYVEIPDPDLSNGGIILPGDYRPGNVGNKAMRLGEITRGDKMSKHLALGFGFYEKILGVFENKRSAGMIRGLSSRLRTAGEKDIPILLRLVQRKIKGLTIPRETLKDISEAIRREVGDKPVFFRSSTNAEDLFGYAGAGLYDSYGMIDPTDLDDIDKYVKAVWASVWNPRAFYDREANNIDHDSVRMAVLVHELIPADYGFVVHTRDPSASDNEEMIIELVQGQGETLVSGKTRYEGLPHRFAVNRLTKEIRRLAFANKDLKIVVEGRRLVEKEADYSNDIFDAEDGSVDGILRRIMGYALDIEKDLGMAQDIEGCLVGRADKTLDVIFVQARDQQGQEGSLIAAENESAVSWYPDDDAALDEAFGGFGKAGKDLGSDAKGIYSAEASSVKKKISGYESDGESMILFADDIVNNAFMTDIGPVMKIISKKNNIFRNGKIVIYAEVPENALLLEKMIKTAGTTFETVVILSSDVSMRKEISSETELVRALIKISRARGAREILGVFKGATKDPERLAGLSRKMEVPVVVFGMEKAIYSFAMALRLAMDVREKAGSEGWLVILPAVRKISLDMEERYQEYLQSLRTMVAA
ncbi:MAG: hypothetical protein HQL30_07625 [Candidatus Omnitrophica bacterium]|nr:hypothetical protein [Candidatus Omnitrophota bacterium]